MDQGFQMNSACILPRGKHSDPRGHWKALKRRRGRQTAWFLDFPLCHVLLDVTTGDRSGNERRRPALECFLAQARVVLDALGFRQRPSDAKPIIQPKLIVVLLPTKVA